MMRRLVVAAVAVTVAVTLRADAYDSGRSGPSETVLRAMQDEMQRSLEQLRLEGLSAPYYIAITLLETHRLDVDGAFGEIKRPREGASRRVQVDLRTGDRAFDDAHFVRSQPGGYRAIGGQVPIEDDYDALRAEIWRLTDRAYKRSLEQLAEKTVFRDANNYTDPLPGLSEDPVVSSRSTLAIGPFDRAAWEARVRDVSAVFRRFPRVQTSSVELNFKAQHVYFVDSEGRRSVKPDHWVEMQIAASTQADDGLRQSEDRQLLWRSPDDVPDAATLRALAEEVGRNVTALADAPQVRTYLGPVLLDGQAAGELFNQLLATELANPREVWVEQQWNEKYYETGSLTGRLGLRVIAPIFDVVDDPTLDVFDGVPLAGHYAIDDQGIPARRVELVERGILRDLLMSRSPTRNRVGSNGHGRGMGAPAEAAIGNLFVTPARTVPAEELKRRLLDEARDFGLDRAILIRRIKEERFRDREALLADPVLAYEVDVTTGEERLVRNAQFQAVTLRALRDILAAGDRQRVYNVGKRGLLRGSATVPSSVIHPSILVSELELVETDAKPTREPYLPHPFFAAPAGRQD